MRSTHKVIMSNFNSLIRGVAAAAAILANAALAQVPANDLCSGAATLTLGAPATPVTSSTTANIAAAAAAVETAFSCTTSVKNSVWYTFTAPATGTYRIETCGVANYDTVLQVYTGTSCGSLTSLASPSCNDEGGTGCTPRSAVTYGLTAGRTYFVQVAAYSTETLSATSSVALTVSYTVPTTTVANDVCTGAVPVTASATATVTSPQSTGLNNTLPGSELGVSCSLGSKADVWYSFVAPATSVYRVDTCGQSNYDTTLALYTGSSCGALTPIGGACNDQGGCTPTAASSVLAPLVAGNTYYVQVAAASAVTLTATLAVAVNVTPLNSAPGDQCGTGSPQLTLNTPVPTLTSVLDAGFAPALDDANVGAAACFTGVGQTSSTATGRDVALQFRAPAAGRYSFRLATPTPSANAVLYLTDSCQPVTTGPIAYSPPQCVAASNRNSTAEEAVTCVPLTANQNVFVWVDETTATSGTGSMLEVTRCTLEAEPNDAVATANDLSCVVTGGIGTTTDVDFFTLGAPPAGSRVFALAEAAAANVTDFDLRITTATRTIEYDDLNAAPAFGGSSGLIAGAVLTGEPSYVRVNYFSATAAEPYVLYSALKSGTPAPEVEPNETIATATTTATNYFTGSITDGGTDIDLYAFNANAGELIFAALDVVPDKTDAGPGSYNFVMSLVDSTNAVLLTVDDTGSTTTFGPTDGGLTASTPTFPAEALVWRARTSGQYGIRVGKTSGTNPNPYILSVAVGCASETTPTLTTVAPNSGTPSGGQTVTLSGTNFNERSVVRFGSTIATVVSVSAAQIVVLSPAASTGTVPVSVTNGPGLVSTLNPGFTYDDPPGLPPVLASITPTAGAVTGGTVVTLTGTVFRADAGVFFEVGGTTVPAASVTVNNATRITATTPPHSAGVANVKVVNFDALESTLPAAFTFEGPPTVATITPNTGLVSGGLTITLTGTNFRAGTTVRIGGTLATGVTIAGNGLSLTAVTPTSTVDGAVDVIVRTTDGQNVTVAGGFTYRFVPPEISTITPGQGPSAGGTVITIVGANFLPNPRVSVGGGEATGVMRTSATQIVALTPAGTPGTADVVVTNSDNQAVTRTAGFRFVPAPTLTAISPANGPAQGGTRITLTGTNFVQGASVSLGGVPASVVTVTSPTTATAVTRPSAPGAVDVVITNPDSQSATLAAGFTYDGAPSLSSLSPISGSTAGGTVVTLIGAGFVPNMAVTFGSIASPTVTRVSNTELTAVTPAAPMGVVTVTATTPDGQSAQLRDSFRFVTPPTLTAAAPNTGDVAGGTVVRLTGTLFKASTSVTFGGVAATQVSLVSDTELDAVTPAHAPGAVDVVMSTDGASATLTGGFTFTRSAPTLAAVAPVSGPITGGTQLTLSGTGFASGATVTVGGAAATDVVIVSDVLARAVVPAHAAGVVDVVFTNDDNQAATLDDGFTYVAPPSNNAGTVTDGGSGSVGQDPMTGGGVPGGVSCGCSSFDGSMFSMAGFGLLLVLSRRRRRS